MCTYGKRTIIQSKLANSLITFLLDSTRKGWDYLARDFFWPDIRTRDYLEGAKYHLTELMQKDEGWKLYGGQYSRIQFLLGEPHEVVECSFRKVFTITDRQIKVLEHFGHYYLVIRRYELAIMLFQMALNATKSGKRKYKYEPKLAIEGMRICKDQDRNIRVPEVDF